MTRYPTDVPVHRPSVGAMGWLGSQIPAEIKFTKPYVYRGTGEDQFPETAPEPKPKPKPKPKRRKPKPKPYVHPRVRWERPSPTISSVEPRPSVAQPEPEPWRDPVLSRPIHRPLRPAPDWRPTTGDDIAALLEEIGT